MADRIPEDSGVRTVQNASSCMSTNPRFIKYFNRYFNVHRKEVTTKELILDYFFDNDRNEFEIWKAEEDHGVTIQSIIDKFRAMTQRLDVREHKEMFFSSEPGLTVRLQRRLTKLIRQMPVTLLTHLLSSSSSGDVSQTSTQYLVEPKVFISHSIGSHLVSWLKALQTIAKKHPADVLEEEYVMHFQQLMYCFGIQSSSGRSMRLVVPEIDVHCVPDTLFSPLFPISSPNYYYPLEAKRMLDDPEFKHYNRILKKAGVSAEEDKANCEVAESAASSNVSENEEKFENPAELQRSIVPDQKDNSESASSEEKQNPSLTHHSPPAKRVKFDHKFTENPDLEKCAEKSDLESAEKSDSDQHDQCDKKNNEEDIYCKLSENTKATVDTFFHQLLGQVVALDKQQPSHGNRRLAIGLVGLRVVFLTFTAKPGVRFSDIPKTDGGKTVVQVTRPLSILDAVDREEIALVLLAIGIRLSDFLEYGEN